MLRQPLFALEAFRTDVTSEGRFLLVHQFVRVQCRGGLEALAAHKTRVLAVLSVHCHVRFQVTAILQVHTVCRKDEPIICICQGGVLTQG